LEINQPATVSHRMTVPLFDTRTPLAPLHDEIRAAIDGVIERGAFILGPEVEAFEREFADYLGARHAIGVANGTDALTLALRALDLGPGDDVVVPSFTFYASAEAIPPTGARPVFCDVDPDTLNVTADTVKAALTPRTKAVIVVHLFGNVAPVEEIAALGVPVLEDAAQAAGARAADGRRPGALGTVATFSFFPSKNLPCFGDGGAVTTNDDAIAERVRMLRFHGSRDKVTFELIGHNSRLDELQATILRRLLPHLDGWTDGRRAAAAAYEEEGLGTLAKLPQTNGCDPAWHLYVIRHERADALSEALQAAGIGSRSYYRVPTHRQQAMREWGEGVELPATEEASRTNLAIPMSPVLTRAQAAEVVSAVRDARLG
jgi:dTDP-4-amino-4,6-dideoxygalactose transaminase